MTPLRGRTRNSGLVNTELVQTLKLCYGPIGFADLGGIYSTPYNYAATLPKGTDLLVVMSSAGNNSYLTGVTWQGDALSKICEHGGTSWAYSTIYALHNPKSGDGTIVLTFSASPYNCLTVLGFTGSRSTPIRGYVANNSASHWIAAVKGDYLVEIYKNNNVLTPICNQIPLMTNSACLPVMVTGDAKANWSGTVAYLSHCSAVIKGS